MGFPERAGSAALHLRLTAFGSVLAILCGAGASPVTAVLLGLSILIVLAKV